MAQKNLQHQAIQPSAEPDCVVNRAMMEEPVTERFAAEAKPVTADEMARITAQETNLSFPGHLGIVEDVVNRTGLETRPKQRQDEQIDKAQEALVLPPFGRPRLPTIEDVVRRLSQVTELYRVEIDRLREEDVAKTVQINKLVEAARVTTAQHNTMFRNLIATAASDKAELIARMAFDKAEMMAHIAELTTRIATDKANMVARMALQKAAMVARIACERAILEERMASDKAEMVARIAELGSVVNRAEHPIARLQCEARSNT